MRLYEMDWGITTVDGFNKEENTAIHVFNFLLKSEQNRLLAIKFICGKIVWCNIQLPKNCFQLIRVDARGQYLTINVIRKFKEKLKEEITSKSENIRFDIEVLFN